MIEFQKIRSQSIYFVPSGPDRLCSHIQFIELPSVCVKSNRDGLEANSSKFSGDDWFFQVCDLTLILILLVRDVKLAVFTQEWWYILITINYTISIPCHQYPKLLDAVHIY